MKKPTLDRDAKISVITAIVIVISYAAQRLLGFYADTGRQMLILLAMYNTVLLLAVTMILLKRTNIFYALLTALFGYKMLPISIPALSLYSADAAMVYYIVSRAAMLIFAFVAYRLYRRQEEPKDLKPLPLVAIMFSVPFFTDIGLRLTSYFELKTGSMLLGFFSQYACYAAATLVMLGLAYAAGYASLRFTAYFIYAALGINIAREVGRAVVLHMSSQHISRSVYGWILLYAALIVITVAVKLIKRKKES